MTACGLYKSPQAPEYFAAEAVADLTVQAMDSGILLQWRAPEKDFRKEKLKYLDGYQIERRGPVISSNELTRTDPDKLVFIVDNHLKYEKELKDQAIEKGEVSRKVKAPQERLKFSWKDEDLIAGRFYAYRVIPINQGGTEGASDSLIQVQFNGRNSRIITLGGVIEEEYAGEKLSDLAIEIKP